MNNIEITIPFTTFDATLADVRKIHIRNINEAMLAARGNVAELNEWVGLAKEMKWVADKLLGDALYGPEVKSEGTEFGVLS